MGGAASRAQWSGREAVPVAPFLRPVAGRGRAVQEANGALVAAGGCFAEHALGDRVVDAVLVALAEVVLCSLLLEDGAYR